MQSQITRPKYVTLGIGVIAVVALFLSLGDPGKEDRQQLMSGLAESQENIHLLEEKIGKQEVVNQQQFELSQQLTRKLEASEDQISRLKMKVDELEKNITRLTQPAPVAKPALKPMAKPSTPVKPTVKPVTKVAPVVTKPVVR